MTLEFRDHRYTTARDADFSAFSPGDVALVWEDRIQIVEGRVWPEPSMAGVIRKRLGKVSLVNVGGSLGVYRSEGTDVQVGNTVEVGADSVLRIISDDPISFLDNGGIDDSFVDDLHSPPDPDGETFEDFAGLDKTVARARMLIEAPLLHGDALSKIGARPVKGILFSGEPGTGKTMLARIIANQVAAEFFELSGPVVFRKWVGESEEMLRALFKKASRYDRSIIFFDEIDSMAGNRNEDSHEMSKRVVAQLLTLMDGFNPNKNVVVIAATNRPQDLDPALRRPGRFDWEIEFPRPGLRDREAILRSSASKLAVSGELPHAHIATLTAGWSAAELTSIWSEAAILAATDFRESIIAEDFEGGYLRVLERKRLSDPEMQMAASV